MGKEVALNLTRKWRSKKFQEIIGQDLAVRILQNSLYKDSFFPVYLFSGQRGCGKTTTARVFAAAMNCENLKKFQDDPKKYQVPCLKCESCVAMSQVQHPDFVEIDAASYTGVDNVRNIIDTSSFLPVLSNRKVYLIDEVHMLSKAAFNAFLKILEEPPPFVVFILATTEIQKLPETVKSRCFQLFFNSVELDVVVKHLNHLCEAESIDFEIEALDLIAKSSDGSLRDAINLLEQSRFADDKVTKEVVCSVLGYLDDSFIFKIISSLLTKKQETLLETISEISKKHLSTEYIVKRLQEFIYDAMMLKYGIQNKYFIVIPEDLRKTVEEVDVSVIISCFNQFSLLDELLAKTSKKQLLLESKLISIILSSNLELSKKKTIV